MKPAPTSTRTRNRRARHVILLATSLILLGMFVVRWVQAEDVAAPPPAARDSAPVPTSKGMPAAVRIAIQFVDVGAVDENAQTFEATVDLRLKWQDPTVRGQEPRDLRGQAAEDAIGEMWTPKVDLSNMIDDPQHRERALITERDGTVELIERTLGTFKTPFRVKRFPFDRHQLEVQALVRESTLDEVVLEYQQDDVAFSRANESIDIEGWSATVVDLRRDPMPGFRGTFHARVVAGLWVERQWTVVVAPVFIPLFSALLIPLLAIWLNEAQGGEFKVEAFELANVLIGGLFAIIALNFTVNGAYLTIASGDNTVTRLFALNYATLGISLVIDIALFRFNLMSRWAGRWIQEQLFLVLLWGIPAISIGTGIAVVAAAACG
jgi:hypothetical protein